MQRAGQRQRRQPESHATITRKRCAVNSIWGQQLRRPARGQTYDLARARLTEGQRAVLSGESQLQGPDVAGQMGREVDLQRRVVGVDGVERRIEGAAGVDDQQVADFESLRYRGKTMVADELLGPARDHQPHAVASQPTLLWRLVRL